MKGSILALTFVVLLFFGKMFMADRQDQYVSLKSGLVLPDSVAYGARLVEQKGFLTLRTGHQNQYYYPGSDSFLYLYTEVVAPVIVANRERSPLNIALVIDRSGSMSGDKLKYAKEAARFVVQNLSPQDFVSIVTYESTVEVVAPAQPVTDKQHLLNLIDAIRTDAATNLSGGMFEGYSQVKANLSNQYVNRVLLMSDGLANVGLSDSAGLVQAAAKMLEETGIGLSTFGVGADFNENLMQSLAENGGNYYFIGQPDQIPDIFAKELNGLLLTAAQNLQLSIDLPAGVSLDKVFGYRYLQSGNRLFVNFRDIFSEEKKAVLLRFKVDPQHTRDLVFTQGIEYVEAASGQNHTQTAETRVNFLEDQTQYPFYFNEVVLQQIIVFESNAALEEAMAAVDDGNYEGARKRIQEGNRDLNRYRVVTPESEEIQTQDSLYNRYEQQIDSVKMMREEDKKLYQKQNKMRNYEMKKKK